MTNCFDLVTRAALSSHIVLCSTSPASAQASLAATPTAEMSNACNTGNGAFCRELAEILRLGRNVPIDLTRARQLHERACSLNDAQGCCMHAKMQFDEQGGPENNERARSTFQRACELNDGVACFAVAGMRNIGLGGAIDKPVAAIADERACELAPTAPLPCLQARESAAFLPQSNGQKQKVAPSTVALVSAQLVPGFQQHEMTADDIMVIQTRIRRFEFQADAMTGLKIAASHPTGVEMVLSAEQLQNDDTWVTVLRGTNSASMFGTVKETGRYRMVVSFLQGTTGRFSFTARINPPAKNIIPLSRAESGQITLASQADGPKRAQRYSTRVKAGQRFRLSAQSDGFAIRLAMHLTGSHSTPMESDETGSSTTLEYVAPSDGQLIVLVLSTDGRTGRYNLQASSTLAATSSTATPDTMLSIAQTACTRTATNSPPVSARTASGDRVSVGENIRGTLSSSDLRLDANARYDSYTLELGANQRLSAMLASRTFAPRLSISGPGQNAIPTGTPLQQGDLKLWQVLFTTIVAGTYTLTATAVAPASGEYILSIQGR